MFNFRTPSPEPRAPKLLRLFRPPLAASVEVQAGHPVRVDSRHVRGHVVSVAGPWRTSGAWWTDDPWEHDEWEVEIAVVSRQWSVVSCPQSGKRVAYGTTMVSLSPLTAESRKLRVKKIQLYRIYCDLRKGHWFVSGIYD